MRSEDLKVLLEKYYEGETSLEEELSLRRFFEGDNIPEGFETEKEIFAHYSHVDKIPRPSDGFGRKIMDAVDRQISGNAPDRKKRMIFYISGVAAGIFLLAGIYFLFDRETGPADTYSDPEAAYAATIEILHNVSSRFNMANRSLRPLVKIHEAQALSLNALNRPANAFEKNLKNLENILKEFEKANTNKNDSPNN
jgi:hypothetical protein